jgi:hypothetical protein
MEAIHGEADSAGSQGPGAQEFPAVGKYRIRLLADPARPGAEPSLDIREYVSSQTFEGFTRRGIRLTARADMDVLRDVLLELLDRAGVAKTAR